MASLGRYVVLVLGLLLVAGGAAVYLNSQPWSPDVTPFEPLQSLGVVMSSAAVQSYAGVAMMALGLVLVTGWIRGRASRKRG